jgi:hypothetical protein
MVAARSSRRRFTFAAEIVAFEDSPIARQRHDDIVEGPAQVLDAADSGLDNRFEFVNQLDVSETFRHRPCVSLIRRSVGDSTCLLT